MSLAIDTYKTINKLQERGFSKEQAEGVVEVITESSLLTKDYFEARLYRALLLHGVAVTAAILAGAQLLT